MGILDTLKTGVKEFGGALKQAPKEIAKGVKDTATGVKDAIAGARERTSFDEKEKNSIPNKLPEYTDKFLKKKGKAIEDNLGNE